MRVLGSAGLKLPSELNVKGSARIETDSSATARVDDAERVNNDGGIPGAATAGKNAAHIKAVKLAQQNEMKRLRIVKARILIGSFLKLQPSNVASEVLDPTEKLVEGPPGNAPWFNRI